METKTWNIGDRVKVKDWCDIDDCLKTKRTDANPHYWSTGKARNCGLIGRIVDRLYSEAFDCYVYTVQFDGQDIPSRSKFDCDAFESVPDVPEAKYHYNIQETDGLVVAILYETVGDEEKEVARGHGHIIHDGVNGFAQASSYALKKLYEKINGGSL